MSYESDSAEHLRARLVRALVDDIGISERLAAQFIGSVMRCLEGQRPYVNKPRRVYPVALIRASLEEGATVKRVCRNYRISRSKLHALFPGGLPKSCAERRTG